MFQLEDVKKYGFEVTWEVIRGGWLYPPTHERLLSLAGVKRFADEIILQTPSHALPYVAELSVATDDLVVTECLTALALESGRAVRIWRFILLQALLADFYLDSEWYVHELSFFWEKNGEPANAPHLVHDTLKPDFYYWEADHDEVFRAHEKWLREERAALLAPKTC